MYGTKPPSISENLLIKIKKENKQIYEQFSQFLQKTIGTKTRLRQLLYGIEAFIINKGFTLLNPPKYSKVYSELIPLVYFDTSQSEILNRLSDYYIKGLNDLNEDDGLKMFYSASLLVQIYSLQELYNNLKETKNKKDQLIFEKYINDWDSRKKRILGLADSFVDKDLEFCINCGNTELNYFYTTINAFSDDEVKAENTIKVYQTKLDEKIIVNDPKFEDRFKKIEQKEKIGNLMYDLLIPATYDNLPDRYIGCPEYVTKIEDLQLFFCKNGMKKEERLEYLDLYKKNLINLIGIENLNKLEIKYPEILRIDFLQKEVAISYYEEYLQNPIDFSISIEAIKTLNIKFLLKMLIDNYSLNESRKNEYLKNIFKEKFDWAMSVTVNKGEGIYSDENLCFMLNFIILIQECFKMGVNDPNQAALLINIWTGSFCKRKIIHKNTLVEVQRLVSHEHFKLLKKFSSQILQKCTKPGMLSKLDLLCPNVTVQEFYEVDSQFV
uniref:Uncharacterized protein n=1 Tax=Meloidogyne floridensis TaxID=298350 RepID=A0A915NR78_9BILA